MLYVAHRINTIDELKKIPPNFGVEVDLRDKGNQLILQHDPFKDGEDFEAYLRHYHHALIILNIKSERIEFKVLALLKKYNISHYFFLDSSFPMIYQLSRLGETNLAVRFSEFEGIDTINNIKDMVKWVWVDCFKQLPLNPTTFLMLKETTLKLCLVSPELQGRDGEIETYRDYLSKNNLLCNAICTKHYNIARWQDSVGNDMHGCLNV